MSMEQPGQTDDPVLVDMIAQAVADPECVGLLLSGSRAVGMAAADSDYDPLWLMTDDAWSRERAFGERVVVGYHEPPGVRVDLWTTSPSELLAIAATGDWHVPAIAYSRVLLDKTGETTAALAKVATLPEEKARADTAAYLDGYINGFYRSLKAARRGNQLGARLEGAESIMFLVRALFALERRWPPYHDRLAGLLGTLDSQGWPPGYLKETLLGLLCDAEPRRQAELELRVEALLRSRGFGHVFDEWPCEYEAERDRYLDSSPLAS